MDMGREWEQRVRDNRTLATVTYEALREAIIRGDLKPGQKIDQGEVAERMNISRMPLREALRRLEGDGLVSFNERHGAFVSELSPNEAEELYLIRERLETWAVNLGCQRVSAEDLLVLKRQLAEMHRLFEAGDNRGLLTLNKAFHMTIYRASGYRVLCHLVEELYDKSLRYRFLYWVDPEHARQSIQEHEDLVLACERRFPAMAEEVVRNSLVRTRESLRAALEDELALQMATDSLRDRSANESHSRTQELVGSSDRHRKD